MKENKRISLEDLERIAGGVGTGEMFHFSMDVFRGGEKIDWVPCCGREGTPSKSLRACVHLQQNVPMNSVHIYLPDGSELNYDLSFAENGICEGISLKVIIEE